MTNHESWVVPAGVSSALAVLGAEIPTRIDSCTVWGVVKQWKNQSFCLGRGGEGGGGVLGYRFLPGPVSRVFAREG